MARKANWANLAVDSLLFGWDVAAVVGLRVMKLSACDAAASIEAQRMIAEKIEAAVALQMLAFTGQLGTRPTSVVAKSLGHYGRKVRANRRRLSRR